jgi:starvation-inducible DNA-binding protein
MSDLTQALRKTQATNFTLYLKTHMFHWNVEGPNFNDYHAFWSGVYEDLFGQTDTLAEYLRQLGEYAPGSLSIFAAESAVKDEENYPSAKDMFVKFLTDNQIMINLFEDLYEKAEAAHEHQISNYAADRLGAHKKHAWMARSILK